ncbi:MAG: NUDIX hydrolase [Terriglobales bacterium]
MERLLNIAALRRYQPKRLHRPDLQRSAVLIPVLRNENQDQIVFTSRQKHLGFQPGDVCLPGGKAVPGEIDLSACALREAEEEISLSREQVELIGELDEVVVASRYLVAPFIGLIAPDAPIVPREEEVAELIIVNASDLLTPTALERITHIQEGTPKQTYKFVIGDITIWGATARILKRFLEIGYGARFDCDSPD